MTGMTDKERHRAPFFARRKTRSVRGHALLPIAGLLALVALAGCGSSGKNSASGATSGTKRIGIMIKNTSLPIQGQSIKAFEEGGSKYGYEVSIRSGQGQISQEVNVVQQFVAEHVNLIMMNPSDPVGILPAIAQANAAGIPVIVVNSAVAPSAKTVCYVGVDDVAYGEKEAQALVSAIGTKGNVAVVLGAIGDPPEVNRLAGIKKVLAGYPNIKLAAMQTGNWESSAELSVVQDFLSRYGPGQLNAVIIEEANAQAAQYAHTHGRSEVKFIEGDFPSSVKAGIEQGYIAADVNQDPYTQGVEAMKIAHEYLSGNKTPCVGGKDLLPLPIVTKANATQFKAGWQG
jgi:ribose transport system substrate-binding protein